MTHQDVYEAQAERKAAQAAGWRTLDQLADAAGIKRGTLRSALKRCKDDGTPVPAALAEKLAPLLSR